MLQKIWTAIVGATCGGCVGLVAAMVIVFLQLGLAVALWTVVGCIGLGFVLGLVHALK